MKPTREQAKQLLLEYTDSQALIRHALQVEAAMLHFADYFGAEDREKWGVIGLCHDLDYDRYPDQHCTVTKQILEKEGWDETYIRAIMSHGYGMVTDVKPETTLEKTLYAVDELTGIINAACLLRPSKSVLDLTVKSLTKKFKDKHFAAGCNRDVITQGCEMLDMERQEFFAETIKGLQKRAEIVGLKGNI